MPLDAMSIPSQPNEDIERLFQKHVPEVAAGVVELVSITREHGKGVVVTVRSRDAAVHPVFVISYHLRAIRRDVGEKVTVWLWSESPEHFRSHE